MNPPPLALALADDVATLANQLSALATRADDLLPRVPGERDRRSHPAYYALNRAWHQLDAACDLLNGRVPR